MRVSATERVGRGRAYGGDLLDGDAKVAGAEHRVGADLDEAELVRGRDGEEAVEGGRDRGELRGGRGVSASGERGEARGRTEVLRPLRPFSSITWPASKYCTARMG